MTLETTELHPLFAVRVNGLDIRAGVNERQFEALRDAFEEYSVVVLRGQALNKGRDRIRINACGLCSVG